MPDPLTPAELRALVAYVAEGGYQQAADAIGCKPDTIRTHLREVRRKLGAVTTAQAFYFLVRDGRVAPSRLRVA